MPEGVPFFVTIPWRYLYYTFIVLELLNSKYSTLLKNTCLLIECYPVYSYICRRNEKVKIAHTDY